MWCSECRRPNPQAPVNLNPRAPLPRQIQPKLGQPFARALISGGGQHPPRPRRLRHLHTHTRARKHTRGEENLCRDEQEGISELKTNSTLNPTYALHPCESRWGRPLRHAQQRYMKLLSPTRRKIRRRLFRGTMPREAQAPAAQGPRRWDQELSPNSHLGPASGSSQHQH